MRPWLRRSTWGGYLWVGNGCPPKSRLALCQAFIAKAVWDFPTTRDLIDAIRHRPALRRLCGWETLGAVPSEATFSRSPRPAPARRPAVQRFCKRLIEEFTSSSSVSSIELCVCGNWLQWIN